MDDFHTQLDKLDQKLVEIKKFVRYRSTKELKSDQFKQLLKETDQCYQNLENLWKK